MEIILAFFVFFGGFTLGSIAAEKESGLSQPARIDNKGSGIENQYQSIQTIKLSDTRNHHISHTPIYRDLTRSNHRVIETFDMEDDDCEEESFDE